MTRKYLKRMVDIRRRVVQGTDNVGSNKEQSTRYADSLSRALDRANAAIRDLKTQGHVVFRDAFRDNEKTSLALGYLRNAAVYGRILTQNVNSGSGEEFYKLPSEADLVERLQLVRSRAIKNASHQVNRNFGNVIGAEEIVFTEPSGSYKPFTWCLPPRWWSDVYRKGIAVPHKDVLVMRAERVNDDSVDLFEVEVMRWIPGSAMRHVKKATRQEKGYVVRVGKAVFYNSRYPTLAVKKARKWMADAVARRIGATGRQEVA